MPQAATGARDLRVLSLDPANVLTPLAVQPLTEPPISVCMATMAHSMCAMAAAGGADEDAASEGAVAAGSSTYVVVGLENGLHITSQLDTASGKLNNPRTRCATAARGPWLRARRKGEWGGKGGTSTRPATPLTACPTAWYRADWSALGV